MLSKHGSYYADWRDAHGRRKRKAFPTSNEAKEHAEKMRLKTLGEDTPRHPMKSRDSQSRKRRGTGSRRKIQIPISDPRSVR